VLAIGYDSATIRLRSAGSLLCKGATRSPTAEQIVEAYEQLYAPPAEPSPALKASTGADKRVAELEARPKSQSSKSRCIMSLQLRSASITDFTSQHHRHHITASQTLQLARRFNEIHVGVLAPRDQRAGGDGCGEKIVRKVKFEVRLV